MRYIPQVFIIDTGLYAGHADFNGRVDSSCSDGTSYGTYEDDNGHG
jgi:hypothetical protein